MIYIIVVNSLPQFFINNNKEKFRNFAAVALIGVAAKTADIQKPVSDPFTGLPMNNPPAQYGPDKCTPVEVISAVSGMTPGEQNSYKPYIAALTEDVRESCPVTLRTLPDSAGRTTCEASIEEVK